MRTLDFWRANEPRNGWDFFTKEFDRLFSDWDKELVPLNKLTAADWSAKGLVPACDVEETEKAFTLSFDIPGMNKDDLDIEISGDQLVISGERKFNDERTEGTTHRSERRFGKFKRVFSLPDNVDVDRINAQYDQGVLTVELLKQEAAKPRKVTIGAAGKEGRDKGFFKKINSSNEEKAKVG